jgi:hypothetical protein
MPSRPRPNSDTGGEFALTADCPDSGQDGASREVATLTCDDPSEFATSVNSRVINRHLEANGLKSGEFDGSPGMRHSLQKASFVKSRVANLGSLRGFDEPYRGAR